MKAFVRIFLLFILLTLLLVVISFAYPGIWKFSDTYQVAIQKRVIHKMEKMGSVHIFHWRNPDPRTADAIQLSELSPFLDELKPGTLFFSIQGSAVSELFIKGAWKHCGIYIGTLRQIEQFWGEDHDLVKSLRKYYTSEDEYLIFDSSYEQGVAIHSIREMAGLADISTLRRLLLFEFKLDKEKWSLVLQGAILLSGKEYDYCYALDDDEAFYCSEFLYKILPLERNYFVPSAKILGRPSLLPSDLVHTISKRGVSSGNFSFIANISREEVNIIKHSFQ